MNRRRIEIVDALSTVPQDAWDPLTREASPFLEWGWLASLEQTGCVSTRTGWLPQHVTIWEGSSLVAAMPMYVKAHSAGEFVFDWGWDRAGHRFGVRYYPKLLVAIPFTPARGSRMLVAPGSESERADLVSTFSRAVEQLANANGLSSTHVLFALPHEVDALEKHRYVRRLTIQFQWTNYGYADFDAFLACLSSRKRHQIRRERREVTRCGVQIETIEGDAITDDLLRTMYRLHTDTCERHVWSGQYLTEAFYEILARRFRHRIQMVVARRDADVIAAAFNVFKGDTLYGRYWGCTETVPFLHFEVCYYRAIEECIRRGLRHFSPGAGGGYKFMRAFEPELEHSAHRVYDAAFGRLIERALEEERREVRAHVKQLRHRSPLRRSPGDL